MIYGLILGATALGGAWYWLTHRPKTSNNNPLTGKPFEDLVHLQAGEQINIKVGTIIDFKPQNGSWILGSSHSTDNAIIKKLDDNTFQAIKVGKTSLTGEILYNPTETLEGKAPEKRSYTSEVWVF
jgi:hypothetical protein